VSAPTIPPLSLDSIPLFEGLGPAHTPPPMVFKPEGVSLLYAESKPERDLKTRVSSIKHRTAEEKKPYSKPPKTILERLIKQNKEGQSYLELLQATGKCEIIKEKSIEKSES
jgi:hypothetical protein